MVLNIKNKVKREQVFRKQRREHTQARLKARIERAELEKKDPALKAVSISTSSQPNYSCLRVSFYRPALRRMFPKPWTTCAIHLSRTARRPKS